MAAGRCRQAPSEDDNIERVRHVVIRKVGGRWQEALRPNRDKRIRAICVNICLIIRYSDAENAYPKHEVLNIVELARTSMAMEKSRNISVLSKLLKISLV